MQQGSSATIDGAGTSAGTLTDEQILGMDGAIVAQRATTRSGADPEDFPEDGAELGRAGEASAAQTPGSPAAEGAVGVPRATAEREKSFALGAQDEPAWMKTLEAQPEAAAEARQWRAAAQDVAAMDAAYFSADAGARSGFASRLYENDPGAFRAMLAESARVLASRDPQALAELARQLGATESTAPAAQAKSVANALRDAQPPSPTQLSQPVQSPANASRGDAAFPAEAYRAFESITNAEVSRRMSEAIDRTLRSTLPDSVAEGARRRIGDDISREIHTALSSDRALTQQVSDVLRDWRFDGAAQQHVVSLLSGRARTVLPEVARRVVAEWTSSVLASDRARSARIDAAASRRDVTGGRLPEPVAAGALRPRDIDYGHTSDEQIMEM